MSRLPSRFYQPLAIGAPMPHRELPVRLERMIHFMPPHVEKLRAKLPDLISQVDVVLGNLEDAIAIEDKEAARNVIQIKLMAVEAGVVELLLRPTRQMRDQLVEQSRKLGTATPAAKQVRAVAEGLTAMVAGLEAMLESAETGDNALRAEAEAKIDEARKLLSDVG